MPVSDQWKLREKNNSVGPVAPTFTTKLKSSSTAASSAEVPATASGKQATSGFSGSPANKAPTAAPVGSSDGDSAGNSTGRTTKNLTGFWSAQNDEVKVRKKRLVQVDSQPDDAATDLYINDGVKAPSCSSTAVAVAGPSVVENTPCQQDANVARAEDPGEWQKPITIEPGRAKNFASVFQQQQQPAPAQRERRQQQPKTDRWSIQSSDSTTSGRLSSTSSMTTPEAVLNRQSDLITLAENKPAELGADVVRSEGSSWDDVAELEAGRTKNLLARWQATEKEFAVPKTSTTRYQGGSKPAWILEIEAAKESTTGAIGSTWTGETEANGDSTTVSVTTSSSSSSAAVPDVSQQNEPEQNDRVATPTPSQDHDILVPELVGTSTVVQANCDNELTRAAATPWELHVEEPTFFDIQKMASLETHTPVASSSVDDHTNSVSKPVQHEDLSQGQNFVDATPPQSDSNVDLMWTTNDASPVYRTSVLAADQTPADHMWDRTRKPDEIEDVFLETDDWSSAVLTAAGMDDHLRTGTTPAEVASPPSVVGGYSGQNVEGVVENEHGDLICLNADNDRMRSNTVVTEAPADTAHERDVTTGDADCCEFYDVPSSTAVALESKPDNGPLQSTGMEVPYGGGFQVEYAAAAAVGGHEENGITREIRTDEVEQEKRQQPVASRGKKNKEKEDKRKSTASESTSNRCMIM